jgi:aminopeptidase YwaD
MDYKITLPAFMFILGFSTLRIHGQIPLLSEDVVRSFQGELSGETAKRNLEYITRLHRMRGSAEFKEAINFIEGKLKAYKLSDIEVIQIPMDGKTFYGTQKSRLAWEAEFAELWEMNGDGKPVVRIADWQSMPITLAEDSESGEATTELIDIGAGTSEQDYAAKNVNGKIVLTSSSPDAVVPLAIEKFQAVGIVSYTQNQPTAWWKEDENLIRWGHLRSFSPTNTFCFMVSLKQARSFQQRLAGGEKITLKAKVKAGQHPGFYSIVTAVIRGSDPSRQSDEIAFTCHLDHQRPGANDNASGSVTILEIARSLQKLIDEGRLERPKRTLRFIWSPEIEGTLALLNQRPEFATQIKANIHMDMVGGGPVTKSIFHVAGGPKSLPSFIPGIGEAFGEYLNTETDAFASGYHSTFPFVSQEGGKEPLQAVLGQFHMGSDHDVYQEGSFKIPSVYMHDWPDRYIHTNFDMAANIDPTKLKRAGFIGAASGYVIANLDDKSLDPLWVIVQKQSLKRTSQVLGRKSLLSETEFDNLWANHFNYERAVFSSLNNFVVVPATLKEESSKFFSQIESLHPTRKPVETRVKVSSPVYKRNADVKGPLAVFGYDYFTDHLGKDKAKTIRLLNYEGLWGHEYAYETLNFVDGVRNVSDIRNAVAAEFGPIPLNYVEEYLAALESIQVVGKVK